MADSPSVLFVCESYYLRFYAPLADRLHRSGFRPIWITLDGPSAWPYEMLDLSPAIDDLAATQDAVGSPELLDRLTLFERIVFGRPDTFKDNYSYTIKNVRTAERARLLADAWYRATLALLDRFKPSGVFFWNGRYLPYSALSAACQAAGQLFFTSEIGWLPGTIFLDRGPLSTNTTDLAGRTFESVAETELPRAVDFLQEYVTLRATMVSQTIAAAPAVRQRLLGGDGKFLLLYGCQVDWDTNVVIGARRFHSNESAVQFLTECVSAVPGARVVVKTHPLDSDKKEERLRNVLGDRGTVVSDIHPHTLIEAADCVAIRNSTLGFEALCYGKPVMALEDAKYTHPRLTLGADSIASGQLNVSSVFTRECRVPDPGTLRQFIVHLLDRYLVPGSYDYHFDRTTLGILSHFEKNQSHRDLEALLNQAAPSTRVGSDPAVERAIAGCELRRATRSSSWSRRARRILDRLS